MGGRVWVVGLVAAVAAAASPAASAETLAADGAVYRSGLTGRYFHPLASFGRLNSAVTAGERRRAARLAESLIARGQRSGRFGLVWRYDVPGGRTGWTSGLAQAVAAQALARAGRRGEARRAFLAIPNGLLAQTSHGPWIRLYSYSAELVLNAQLQAALSIGEYARLTGDERARRLARQLRRSARALLPRFDTGSWSRYSFGGRGSTLAYHTYVTQLLWKLSARQRGGVWRVYANRFSSYHRVPPALRAGPRPTEVLPVPDGFRDFTQVRFWLSKPATVTFRIAGTRTSLRYERGWRTFAWWPSEDVQPGRYPVWATATDRAGNSTLLGLPWVTVGADTEPPAVRLEHAGGSLAWRASDPKSPWFEVSVERRVDGRLFRRELGRFPRRGEAELHDPPVLPGTTAVIVRDSSGNETRIPLCPAF